jgi:hypothetical protein
LNAPFVKNIHSWHRLDHGRRRRLGAWRKRIAVQIGKLVRGWNFAGVFVWMDFSLSSFHLTPVIDDYTGAAHAGFTYTPFTFVVSLLSEPLLSSAVIVGLFAISCCKNDSNAHLWLPILSFLVFIIASLLLNMTNEYANTRLTPVAMACVAIPSVARTITQVESAKTPAGRVTFLNLFQTSGRIILPIVRFIIIFLRTWPAQWRLSVRIYWFGSESGHFM